MIDESTNSLPELLGSCLRDQTTVIRRPDGKDVPIVERRIMRVELHGIARFACWWFVIVSGLAVVVAITRM
jgi:hypothetical protein